MKASPGVASVVGVVNVLFVESRALDVEGGGGFSIYCVVMALDGLVAPSFTGHLQAAYRPRDVAKQREPARTSDQLEQQFRGGFRAFAQVSGLGCIDLGDRRSRVQISAARPKQLLLPRVRTVAS